MKNKWIVAYDGGGTKTEIVIFDLYGKCHYQNIYINEKSESLFDMYQHVIGELFITAINTLDIQYNDIKVVLLGLSGADREEDFDILNTICHRVFKNIHYKIVNDAWIIFRSGVKEPYGAVAIAGTGTNAAAINHQGKQAILRSLSYTTGTFGGGLDIAREALHYAFRADELTYKDTIIKEKVLDLLDITSMNELASLLYPKQQLNRVQMGQITGLVFDCASQGDEVAIEILTHVGTVVGEQLVGVIKQLHMENDNIPIVIGGRVFESNHPILINAFKEVVFRFIKKAYIVRPKFKPVIGAYFMALDDLNIIQTNEIEEKLLEEVR